ncbi:hypothetical protein BofuT4_P151550.1 [Botrytis cinerea T4]|uniref:Uncharacterized protein n=1 Tax=Botryotinia fuckeliana (strain T4) TaxID=999810 RepID=G2YWM5_BOTF4|nr:hypothetical protein BofuT4_P151550.1 [Botrytis cinerea T4]
MQLPVLLLRAACLVPLASCLFLLPSSFLPLDLSASRPLNLSTYLVDPTYHPHSRCMHIEALAAVSAHKTISFQSRNAVLAVTPSYSKLQQSSKSYTCRDALDLYIEAVCFDVATHSVHLVNENASSTATKRAMGERSECRSREQINLSTKGFAPLKQPR